jgi:hypothetical protein
MVGLSTFCTMLWPFWPSWFCYGTSFIDWICSFRIYYHFWLILHWSPVPIILSTVLPQEASNENQLDRHLDVSFWNILDSLDSHQIIVPMQLDLPFYPSSNCQSK